MQTLTKHSEAAAWDDLDWGDDITPVEETETVPPPSAASPAAPSNPVPVAEEAPAPQAIVRREKEEPNPAQPVEAPTPPPRPAAEKPKPPKRPASPAPADREHTETVEKTPGEDACVFTPRSEATLTLRDEQGQETAVTLRDDLTVGRHRNNGLVIKDLYVSSYHAKLVCREDGVFEAADLDSTGGTFVNGVPIQRQALASGDEVTFATVSAVFRYVAGPQFDSEQEPGGTLVARADVARQRAAQARLSARQGRLIVTLPGETRRVEAVAQDRTVGRAEDNDVVLANSHVSGHHARILCSRGGLFEIMDLNSTCGTFVNGVPVQNAILAHGDRVRFGTVECLFQIVDAGK